MRKRLFLIVLPSLLAAAPSGHVARLGRTVMVDGPRVTPLAVLEDTRCPILAQCVWAGRVRIRARIAGGTKAFVREMEIGKPIPVFDGQLTLEKVTPERPSQQPKPRTYQFTFTFVGGL
jgi:hypothetical protein